MKELSSVEPDKPYNRFNDAKCDRMGRLWAGTLGLDNVLLEKCGNLYSFNGGNHDISKPVKLNLTLQITLIEVFTYHVLVFI